MLDKSVEYRNIIMRMPVERVEKIAPPRLPEGFSIRTFQPGDEKNWVRIETAVLEFDRESDAMAYFTEHFLPHGEDLSRRCLFICDETGKAVATATAWYEDSGLGHQAVLEWVSVDPGCQGKGLGTAVVSAALALFPKCEPGLDVYLHTQTWSYKAVGLYHKVGFSMDKTGTIPRKGKNGEPMRLHLNEYAAALSVMRPVIPPALYDDLQKTAL